MAKCVKENKAPKSADKLLQICAGREEELLEHLRKIKIKLNQWAESKALMVSTNPNKIYNELTGTYARKEDDLVKNLWTIQAKQQAASWPLWPARGPGRALKSCSRCTRAGRTS